MKEINEKSVKSKLTKHWYIIYVRGKFEKKVASILCEKNIEIFFPLLKSLRQWKDRKKFIDLPLFPNYIFIKVDETQLNEALKIKGVLHLVVFAGKPVTLTEKKMQDIMRLINNSPQPEVIFEVHKTGDKVVFHSGPLKGMKGTLLHRLGKYKVCVEIEAINASVLVEVDVSDIKKL